MHNALLSRRSVLALSAAALAPAHVRAENTTASNQYLLNNQLRPHAITRLTRAADA